MRKKMIAGNWKMNKLNSEVQSFFADFAKACDLNKDKSVAENVDILFAVPTLLLDSCRSAASGLGIEIAAQNIHYERSGAFTGETSLLQLAELGIKSTLIGHSERRQFFGETNGTVALKSAAAQDAGFLAVVCVGETLEERNAGLTEVVIRRQLVPVYDAIRGLDNIVLAYEPVWAIGTGVSASSVQAQNVHKFIRDFTRERFGAAADSLKILYGGSANPKNIGELLIKEDIDGALVGGASLVPGDFAAMVKAAIKP